MYNKKKVINVSESMEHNVRNNITKNEERIIKFSGKHLKYLNKTNIKTESEYFKMKEGSQDSHHQNLIGFKKEDLKE